MWEQNWKNLIKNVLENGKDVEKKDNPKRNFKEIVAEKFEFEDPRDRLIHDESLSMSIFQSVGQFLWITQGNFMVESIGYYQPSVFRLSTDQFRMIGAYGPRLFGVHHLNQMDYVRKTLRDDSTKRKAVASIYLPQFDQHGLPKEEVPCTLNLQYLIRNDSLNAVTFMRSQDVYKILPTDFFVFTMLHEYMTSLLYAKYNLELGRYHHFSGSFHVYDEDNERVCKSIENTSTFTQKMNPMPIYDAEIDLRELNKFETLLRYTVDIRKTKKIVLPFEEFFEIAEKRFNEKYWKQLALLLIYYAAFKIENEETQKSTYKMLEPVYQNQINLFLKKIENAKQR